MSKIILTCAVTGAAEVRSPHVPITPSQIATSAIEARGGRGERGPPTRQKSTDRRPLHGRGPLCSSRGADPSITYGRRLEPDRRPWRALRAWRADDGLWGGGDRAEGAVG